MATDSDDPFFAASKPTFSPGSDDDVLSTTERRVGRFADSSSNNNESGLHGTSKRSESNLKPGPLKDKVLDRRRVHEKAFGRRRVWDSRDIFTELALQELNREDQSSLFFQNDITAFLACIDADEEVLIDSLALIIQTIEEDPDVNRTRLLEKALTKVEIDMTRVRLQPKNAAQTRWEKCVKDQRKGRRRPANPNR